jgi:hypothetical protein
MTDENLLSTEQPQGISNDAGMGTVSNDFGTQSPSATQKSEEYVPKSRVTELMHAQSRKAYEKGLQDARQSVQQPQQSTDIASSSFNEDKIRNLIKQEAEALERKRFEDAQRLQQEQESQRLYADLHNKFNSQRKVDPKFDEKLAEVNYFNDMPGLQYVLNQFDNAGELAAYLYDNGSTAVNIDSLARIRDRNGRYNPNRAIADMRKIADRLKQNEAAKTAPVPPSPISQVETTVRDGVKVSGESSFRDYKKRFRS